MLRPWWHGHIVKLQALPQKKAHFGEKIWSEKVQILARG
jgi:hypothetical protein